MVKKHLRPHWRGLPTSRSSRRPKQAASQEGLERPAAEAGSAAGRLPHGRDLTLCTIFFIAFFDDLGFLSSITAESARKSCIACILCHPAPSAVAPIPSRACRSGRRRPILKRPATHSPIARTVAGSLRRAASVGTSVAARTRTKPASETARALAESQPVEQRHAHGVRGDGVGDDHGRHARQRCRDGMDEGLARGRGQQRARPRAAGDEQGHVAGARFRRHDHADRRPDGAQEDGAAHHEDGSSQIEAG